MSERGMKKWAPYKSLNEQENYLNKLHKDNEKVEKPRIFSDVAEEINEILVNYQGGELLITFYRNNKIQSITSTIKKIDADNKKIVLPDRKTIYFTELVGLERVR